MMLKITKIQESRSDVLLKLEGKITLSGPPSSTASVGRSFDRRKPCIWIAPMSISSMPAG